MSSEKAEQLLRKYNKGNATPEERRLVEDWYLHSLKENEDELADLDLNGIKKALDYRLKPIVKSQPNFPFYRYAAAAIILISLSIGVYIQSNKNVQTSIVVPGFTSNDIEPGGNRAILTLADGRKIDLDSAIDGMLTQVDGVTISKNEDGLIEYEISSNQAIDTATPAYNTINTPNGGQYKIILPDGSAVWLNAATSFRYPTRFSGDQRTVELTGEAYFEITENKKMPFIVKSKSQEVKVLGTHFNINAYDDELAVKTSLLEGSVLILQSGTNNSQILKPGEQSILQDNQLSKRLLNLDTEIAWKQGDFIFKKENIESIMRKLARWYDIEVNYQGKVNNYNFSGMVSRSNKLSTVLEMLESTGQIKFKVEDRRVVIMM